MKKVYTILCLTIASLTQLQAQAPQGFNYQATVRNSAGDLIVNTNVYFKFNVMQGSQTSLPVFTEIHYVPTDDLGQVNLVIGQGTATTGAFSELDWSLGSYYLGIELDTGSGYVAMGTTQLLSVPYALYAENSGNSTPTTPNLEAVLAENNSANNQKIKDLQDPTEAQDAATKAYVDTEVSNNVQNIEQVLTLGNDANGLQLKGIADPTDAQDAVTKAYLENNTTSSGLTPGNTVGDMLYWDGENWTQINAPENNGTLKFCDGQLTWGPCRANIKITGFNLFIPGSFNYNVLYVYYLINTNDSDIYNIRAYVSESNPLPDENDNVYIGYSNSESVYPADLQSQVSVAPINPGSFYIRLSVESSLGISYSEVVQYSFTELDLDNDNDGYTENQGDCDDNNAQINPGATEIEDGVDNDCDGDIDEGFDVDGDGYSLNQGDCDDANAQVNPGATEIEDGIDNDCDGDIDEGFDASGTVTDQDGNTYDYLTYGNQVWTVENAEMISYRDGTPIPQVTDATEWQNLNTGAWAYYENDPTKGKLYNWYAVMGIHDTDPNTPNKEFAPEGWHVPTDAEWTTLENYLIANGYNYDGTTTENKIAKAMASTTGWSSSIQIGAPGNDQSLNNSSDFNAFPEGHRTSIGSFLREGEFTVFWSSTEYNTNDAWYRLLPNGSISLLRSKDDKRIGLSVRFVRD
jgi:uncharacterized protein (TIGR02145 family)